MASKVSVRSEQVAIPLREPGALRLAVVADTHSRMHANTLPAIAELAPDAILHAGDIGDLGVLDALREVAPLHAVRGNIDERAPHLPDVLTIDLRAGAESAIKILLTHIAVQGPRLRVDAARAATERGAKVVVCGHSHVPFLGRDRGLTVFNPGSCGPKRFALPILFGVLEIADGKLTLRHVDCETGEPFVP